MIKYIPRCKDCDCALWSEYARKLGVCPECEGQEEHLDLEGNLEILLEKSLTKQGYEN